MKIALAQLNFHIGDFGRNTDQIISAIQKAKAEDAQLIVFSELAVCGYPPRDFLEFSDFINRCNDALKRIAAECRTIAAIIGAPSRNTNPKGKDLYNSAVVISQGKVISYHHKALLPTYDVFDEYRYFEPGTDFLCVEIAGKKLAITICEDLWNIGDDPMYVVNPMDELIREQPDFIINIAASPFHYHQAEIRTQILQDNARKYQIPLVYVNHVGAQTELLFDGGSMALDQQGNILKTLGYFHEDFAVVDFNAARAKKTANAFPPQEQRIHDALVMGIRDYFLKLGFQKAILGLSGGIDSAVTLALAAEALGPDNVRALLLPSRFSSEHSIEDARALAENLGCPYDLIPIETAFSGMEETLQPFFKDLPFNIAEENIQARLRAVILMAFSNKFGYILLNTSNKSEAAVGYGTLYGDMCGGISVLGDVYKTQVYQLAHYINRDKEIIPLNSIVKPPSAELRPDQKDSDSLPDYDILDKILFEYIENRLGPAELVELGYEKQMVDRVCKLVNASEYKRYQTPPILRVSPKAFGMGRRLPIVARYLS
jgi:NAD+ synthase (glutamine-hydrolysing)